MRSAKPKPELARALAAEALGTALLVAGVVGSGIMASHLTQDSALALLCNTIATGAILSVLILVLAPISGAHFNPTVTWVFALKGEISVATATLYSAVQFAGGIAGTLAAHAMFALPLFALGTTARTGAGMILAEAIATFGLVLTILGARARGALVVGPAVGLYIAAAYWFTASTSFANPAVTLARALTPSFAGIRPSDVPPFLFAQIVGALLGGWIGSWLFEGARAVRASSSSPSNAADVVKAAESSRLA